MRTHLLGLTSILVLHAQISKSTSYIDKFRSISVSSIRYLDLCSGELQVIPKEAKVELWSVNCGNCLQEIEDTAGLNWVLVNVDETPEQKAKACAWIRSKNLKSLSDSNNSIKSQMGGRYPVPTELKIKDSQVHDVTIGYWSQSKTLRK